MIFGFLVEAATSTALTGDWTPVGMVVWPLPMEEDSTPTSLVVFALRDFTVVAAVGFLALFSPDSLVAVGFDLRG